MREPPGFRGEEVCAEECNQPDKHENSQAHLPDLQGVYHILNREFSNADCQLDTRSQNWQLQSGIIL